MIRPSKSRTPAQGTGGSSQWLSPDAVVVTTTATGSGSATWPHGHPHPARGRRGERASGRRLWSGRAPGGSRLEPCRQGAARLSPDPRCLSGVGFRHADTLALQGWGGTMMPCHSGSRAGPHTLG
jgi:hypothetical protein